MNQVRVHLLGKFSARRADGTAIQFSSQKEEELLSYLLVNRGQLCPRESLASLLWGGSDPSACKKYLRTALWHLKSDLGFPSSSSDAQCLKSTFEWIQLQRSDRIWADIDAVAEASALIQRSPEEELSAEQASALLETIDLYQGEFLEGCHQEWCLYERERYQQSFFRLIDRMMTFCEADHDFHAALALGRRLLRQEPARECTHRRMMVLYAMAGDRCSAIRQFERCVEALREELGVRPSRLTLQLYEQIRTACAESEGTIQPSDETAASASLSLRKVLEYLSYVRSMIGSIETEVTLEMQRLKGAPDRISE